MKRIIIVGDFCRDDFLSVARLLQGEVNFFFLDYLDASEITNKKYQAYGRAIFWKDYRNAFELIDSVAPDLVIFYFIESYNHVALNLACKKKGIKTFHLEHGIRYYAIQENINATASPAGVNYADKLRKLTKLYSKVKNRMFYKSSLRNLPEADAAFLRHYYSIRSKHNIFETFKKVNDPRRLADSYISFSPAIFAFHQVADHLPPDYPVHFIGCPSFDHLAADTDNIPESDDILFLDASFESQHLFGWTFENKVTFLKQLATFAERHRRKLWVKPHPYSQLAIYEPLKALKHVELVHSEEELLRALTQCSIITGFYSTLLMPLMARKETVCFSFDMHPSAPAFKPGSFLVETGAIDEIPSWDKADRAINNLTSHLKMQQARKAKFISDWLYRFDGLAGHRLKTILVHALS